MVENADSTNFILKELTLNRHFCICICKLFFKITGGKDGVINPMVHNMAPGYENAKYDLIWVSTSRIKASNDVIYDMVARCQDPYVAIRHQMPFMMNDQVIIFSCLLSFLIRSSALYLHFLSNHLGRRSSSCCGEMLLWLQYGTQLLGS